MTTSAQFSSTSFGALYLHCPLCSEKSIAGSCSLSADTLSFALRSGRTHSASVLGIGLLMASSSCRPCIYNFSSNPNVSSPLEHEWPYWVCRTQVVVWPFKPYAQCHTPSTLPSPSHSPTWALGPGSRDQSVSPRSIRVP